MKNYILIILAFITFNVSCKTKQKTETFINNNEQIQNKPDTRTIGKVSHQYRASGCSTVIIVNTENQDKPLTLIPREPLPSKLDVDGLGIKFNYRTLRMPNPQGCLVGLPAEITDISKK